MAVLNTVLYSISWIYQIFDYDDPCKASTVVRSKEGAKIIVSKPVIKTEPITARMLHKTVQMFYKDGKKSY